MLMEVSAKFLGNSLLYFIDCFFLSYGTYSPGVEQCVILVYLSLNVCSVVPQSLTIRSIHWDNILVRVGNRDLQLFDT